MRKAVLSIVAVLSYSGWAFADDTSMTSLAELKAKCVELNANQQIKPFKIQVTCSQTEYVWKPVSESSVSLPNQLEVGASLRMKNFEVPYAGQLVDTAATQAACPVFQRVKNMVPAVDVELTCDEVNAVTDLATFCGPHIKDRVANDPGIVVSEATDQQYSLCGQNQVQGQGQAKSVKPGQE